MAKIEFDANNIPPHSGYTPLPEGDYEVIITNSQMRVPKSGVGNMLVIQMEILEPAEYKGRRLYENLCIKHPNEDAMRIAQSRLSAICHAVGVLKPRDSDELHERPFIAKVKVKRGKDDSLENSISGFKPLNAAVNTRQVRGVTPTSAAAVRTTAATDKEDLPPYER